MLSQLAKPSLLTSYVKAEKENLLLTVPNQVITMTISNEPLVMLLLGLVLSNLTNAALLLLLLLLLLFLSL